MNTATMIALVLWATTSAAIIAGALALQYRAHAAQATARAQRAYSDLAAERNRNAEHMRQHAATLTRAAGHIDRLAAIIHGIKGRMARGTASSPEAASLVDTLPELAGLARAMAERKD